jgi:hypothetical protein
MTLFILKIEINISKIKRENFIQTFKQVDQLVLQQFHEYNNVEACCK